MTYRLSRRALRNLEDIHEFIGRDNPDAAADAISKVVATFDRLTAYPRLGHPGRREGTREFVHPPYVIVYAIEGDTIRIYAVLHGRRQYS